MFSEGDNHQARPHHGGERDVRGPAELHENEHLPGQHRSLVLAKAQVKIKYLQNFFYRKML